MIEEFLSILGVITIMAAFLIKRTSYSLLLLFIGSFLVCLEIAVASGPVVGLIVLSLYVGAVNTLILISLMLVPEEEIKLDWLHIASVLIASILLVLLITFLYKFSPVKMLTPAKRSLTIEDLGSIALVLMVSSVGVSFLLKGDEKR